MFERTILRCFRQWEQLVRELGVSDWTEEGFRHLVRKYEEPHRAYHTLSHIAHCLALHDELAPRLADPRASALAIWFHDAIYVPGSKENEQRSVTYLRRCARMMGIDPAIARVASEHVCATSSHSLTAHPDTAFVIDIDLSQLGFPPHRFQADERAIRMEYAAFPDAVFWPARRAVLEEFQRREPLYTTQPIRDRYESRAKENLRCAIARINERK